MSRVVRRRFVWLWIVGIIRINIDARISYRFIQLGIGGGDILAFIFAGQLIGKGLE